VVPAKLTWIDLYFRVQSVQQSWSSSHVLSLIHEHWLEICYFQSITRSDKIIHLWPPLLSSFIGCPNILYWTFHIVDNCSLHQQRIQPIDDRPFSNWETFVLTNRNEQWEWLAHIWLRSRFEPARFPISLQAIMVNNALRVSRKVARISAMTSSKEEVSMDPRKLSTFYHTKGFCGSIWIHILISRRNSVIMAIDSKIDESSTFTE
jgi:hypothetical protein